MKKLIAILTVAILIVSITAIAADYPRIRVDGEFIDTGVQNPVIVDGRTLVPLRAVMERLGFDVDWEPAWGPQSLNPYGRATLELARGGLPTIRVVVTIGRDTMSVREDWGESTNIPLDVPAQIINNRTMVPLRAISQAAGMDVDWDDENRIADIRTTQGRSLIRLTNERISDELLAEWKAEYHALGGASEFELEVIRLINVERVNYGLQPLVVDERIMMAARFKSQEMVDLNYFAHESPVYGNFNTIPFELFGIGVIAENLAGGSTPEFVVRAWMNSPGHRANVLRESATHIGIGRVGNLTTMMITII